MMQIIYDNKLWVKNAGTHDCERHCHMGISETSEYKRWNSSMEKVTYRISMTPLLLLKVRKMLSFDKTIEFMEKYSLDNLICQEYTL